MDYNEEALALHAANKGKIEINCKVPLADRADLNRAYTPGVAAPCLKIKEDPAAAYTYTAKGNMVAVVSDGTAVLGLGNIGPLAAIPVMEGKAALFKTFAGIDAVPICLDTTDPDEIVRAVTQIAPCFGGINLEDIASPKCFDIERRLEQALTIPVFHDDQHGTAIVVTAALLNALRLVDKKLPDVRIVLNGPGAAGTAIINMLLAAGACHVTACDEHGILYSERPGIAGHKLALCETTNLQDLRGGLHEALEGADVFIGVSVAGALTADMARRMAGSPIVFAMANPVPEITYEAAKEAGVTVMGTGRSDYPNQINNVLAFPGVFKGALMARARDITPGMKVAAAHAIAAVVKPDELRPDYIIPDIFNPAVTEAVAQAVAEAWLAGNPNPRKGLVP